MVRRIIGKTYQTRSNMHLWINLTDLYELGTIGSFGSPLNLMICKDLGDALLPGAYYSDKRLDDMFVVVSSSPERCEAIKDAMELIGEKKIGRKIRTKETAKPPGKTWRHVIESNC